MLGLDFALRKTLVWIATYVTTAVVCSLSIIIMFGLMCQDMDVPHLMRTWCVQPIYLSDAPVYKLYTDIELSQYMLLLPASCTMLLMSGLSQCHPYTICMLGHILYHIFYSWAFPSTCRMFPCQLPLISGSGILHGGAYPDLALPLFPCICFT